MNKILLVMLLLCCSLVILPATSAGNSTSSPFTCTIWDDILDVFRTQDCGSEYTGLLIYDGESKPTITKYTGTEKNTFIPIINNNEVCFYHKEGTNATNLNDLKIALENAQSNVPLWKVGVSYKINDLVSYNKSIYKVLQAHTSQAGWTPNVVPALFSFYAFQELGEVPTWKQPTGAQDAYKINDRVFFEGYIYESRINANVWSPTAYPAGWTKLGTVYVSEPNSPSNITIQTSVNNLVVPRQTNGSFSIYCTTIQDKIQIGNNTIIIEDQETKSVVYSIGGENNITATVLRDVLHDGNYTNPVNNVWVFVENNKFGANWSSDNTTWEKFKYEIKSDLPIQFYNGNNFDFYGSEAIYRLNVDDICYAGANCTYEINQVGEEYILSIYFYNKDGFIDPTILTVSFTPQSGNIYNDTRYEPNNITHLEIPDNATRYMYAGATADYVYKNNHQFNNTFAFSFWFNRVGATAFGQVVRQTDASFTVANGWRIGTDGAGTTLLWWALNSTGSTCSAGTSMGSSTANTWQHWLVTYNGTRYEIYRDGVNVLNANCAVNMSALVYPVDMGRIVGGYDDLIFYNEYLNSTQVSQIYNNGRFTQLNLSSITDYYSFNGNASNWSNSGTNTTALTTSGSPRTLPDEANTNNPLGSYLQAYYSFDADNTNPNWTTGKVGNALSFPNTADYVAISGLNPYVNLTTEYSISAWFNTPSVSVAQSIFQNYISTTDRHGIVIDSTGRIRCNYQNATNNYFVPQPSLVANTWYHVVYNHYSNGSIDCYLNAVGNSTITTTSSILGTTITGGSLGYNSNAASFNGIIDEVRVFSRVLSETEIANIYSNESVGQVDPSMNTTGLVGEWTLNETEGLTAMDSSGLGNNGALTNYPTWTAYDLTNNNNDGTSVAQASVTSNSIYGKGLVLDGSEDYVAVPDADSLDGYSTMTLSVWVNPSTINWTASSNGVSIINKHTSYFLSVAGTGSGANGGKIYWYTYGNNLATYADYNLSEHLNEWTLLTVVYNGSNGLIYVNGVLNATSSGTNTNPIPNTAQALNLGYYWGAKSWDGSLDEAMIFSKALNATEISQIYNNQSKRFKTEGTVGFAPIGLNESANAVNISLNNAQTNFGTSVQARIGYWNLANGYNTSSSNSLANGLVGYWTGDGNANDYLGINNGTLTGNANASRTGVYNNSFSFDGTNDYVNISQGSNFVFNNGTSDLPFSFSFWMYPTGTLANEGLIIKAGDKSQYTSMQWASYIRTGTHLAFYVYDAEGDTRGRRGSSGITANNLYHVTVVYNGSGTDSGISIYLNGARHDDTNIGTGTYSVMKTANNNAPVLIGSQLQSISDYEGFIDDIMIWNRSLSAEEVKEIYNKGLANWSYGNWKTISEGNVSLTLPINATTIRPEYKLFDGTAEGWYTPYISLQNLVAFNTDTIYYSVDYLSGSTQPGAYNQSFISVGATGSPEELISNITVVLYNSSAIINTSSSTSSSYDINFTNLQEGIYYYNGTITFSTGQVYNLSTRTIYLDFFSPNITLNTPINNTLVNYSSINFTANISDSVGVNNVTLSIYNILGNLISSTTTSLGGILIGTVGTVIVLVDGVYNWFYQAFDLAGNSASTQNNTLTVNEDGPILNVYSPVTTTYNNRSVLINFTAISDGVSLDKMWYGNSTNNYTYTTPTFINLKNGTNNLYFYANDTEGLISSTSKTVDIELVKINSVSISPTSPFEDEEVTTYINVSSWEGDVTCNITGGLGTFSNFAGQGIGQLLYYNLGQNSANTYNLNFLCYVANDTDTYSTTLTIKKRADLKPTNIQLSNSNPILGEQILITSDIYSYYSNSSNVNVRFYDGNVFINETNISAISTNGYVQAYVSHAFTSEGVNLIRVEVDSLNEISESDETNNNATKLLLVGSGGGLGIINISVGLSPNPVEQYSPITVNGSAFYNLLENEYVAGAEVILTIPTDGISPEIQYTAETDGSGNYIFSGVNIPLSIGSYLLTVNITDGSVQGVNYINLDVIGSSDEGVDFSVGAPSVNVSHIVVNRTVLFSAPVYNSRLNVSNVSVYFLIGSEVLGVYNITNLNNTAPQYAYLQYNFSTAGYKYLRVYADYLDTVNETNESNNFYNTIFGLPQFLVYNQGIDVQPQLSTDDYSPLVGVPHNIRFDVRNWNEDMPGNTSVRFYINGVLYNSTYVNSTSRFWSYTTHYTNITFPNSGQVNLTAELNYDRLFNETNYNNNNITMSLNVQDTALPDFIFQDINITPLGYGNVSYYNYIYADNPLFINPFVDNLGDANYLGNISLRIIGKNIPNSFSEIIYDGNITNSYMDILNKNASISTFYFNKTFLVSSLYSATSQNENQIIAEVNYNNDIPEYYYTNNLRNETYKVVMPDLQIISLNIGYNDSEPFAGDNILINALVDNLDPFGDAYNIVVNFTNNEGWSNSTIINISKNSTSLAQVLYTVSNSNSKIFTVSINNEYKNKELNLYYPLATNEDESVADENNNATKVLNPQGDTYISFVNPTDNGGIKNGSLIANITASGPALVNLTLNVYNSSGLVYSNTSLTPTNTYFSVNLADGLYYFNATVIGAGTNSTETRNVTIDNSGPVILINHPIQDYLYPNYQTGKNWTWLNYTTIDATPISTVRFNVYSPYQLVYSNYYISSNFSMYFNSTGRYNLTIIANDSFGQVGTNSTQFYFNYNDVIDTNSTTACSSYGAEYFLDGAGNCVFKGLRIYYPTSFELVYGTANGSTNLGNLTYLDGQYFNFTETGAHGVDLRINYTGIQNLNSASGRLFMSHGEGDYIEFYMWNYATNQWDYGDRAISSVTATTETMPIFNPNNYIQNNLTQVRLLVQGHGNPSHKWSFDYLWLLEGAYLGAGGSAGGAAYNITCTSGFVKVLYPNGTATCENETDPLWDANYSFFLDLNQTVYNLSNQTSSSTQLQNPGSYNPRTTNLTEQATEIDYLRIPTDIKSIVDNFSESITPNNKRTGIIIFIILIILFLFYKEISNYLNKREIKSKWQDGQQ